MHGRWIALVMMASACAIIMASSSAAQPRSGDAARGHELAARLCANCHVVDRAASRPIQADVPSFSEIANRAGATEEYLAGKIIIPHPAMPGVTLTVTDIRDIVAYIVSLKGK